MFSKRISDEKPEHSLDEEAPLEGGGAAWFISLLVHLCVLVVLAIWTLSGPPEEVALDIQTLTELDSEQFEPDDFEYSEEELELGAESVAGMAEVEPTAFELSEVAEIAEPETVEVETEIQVELHKSVDLSRAPEMDTNILVRGNSTTGATGAVGAVDRITHEILLSLEQRPTLVVWIFDRSGSLSRQRTKIQARFDQIYDELGVVAASKNPVFAKHEDKPLLTSIVAFGKGVEFLTPDPTDQLAEIQGAVSGIQTDTGGKENVFSAVHATARRYRKYRTNRPRRNVILVVVTDEAGDDAYALDEAVAVCRRYQMPTYVIGSPAPFGRKETYVKYTHPEDKAKGFSSRVDWVPVNQGPESLFPERIRIEFKGSRYIDERIDSGFGPYALTRLCTETGGMFFSVHPNRATGALVGRGETDELTAHLSQFYDPEVMRSYRPDYVSVKEYEKLLSQNQARRALVEAAKLSWVTPMGSVRTDFPKQSEGALANLLSRAQRDAAKLEPKINAVYRTLALGEKDRKKLQQPRWKAGYDLAIGRALAVKTRTEGYNAMLAQAKNGLKFKNKKSNTWVLKSSEEISTGSILAKQSKAAREYLERVLQEHEGTPWATLASRELKTPLGWTWKEVYRPRNDPKRRVAANNPPRQRRDEKARMLKRNPDTRKPPAL